MNDNEKERPAVSGLDEIFGAAPRAESAPARSENTPARAESAPDRGEDANDAAPENGAREDGSRRSGRRGRRGRRRGRGGHSGANAPQGGENEQSERIEEGASDEADGFGDEIYDIDPNDEGAGGFGDPVSYSEATASTSAPETVEVIGVRFKDTGKTYYFAPGHREYKRNEYAIVDTSRGLEYGIVSVSNTRVPVSAIVPPLRAAIRPATDADKARHEENNAKEKEAFNVCLEKIQEHGLEMKLIDAEYTFDQSKLTFYFSADGRVDFRELVKDLAGVFRTRIELRQIGIRDEAKLIGGLGVCGRPFCCSTFLSDFVQVSIKMAKEQNLSLNSAKISGSCGRLMCCLRFEHDTYAEEIKKTPSVGSRVKTADGIGVVSETSPLIGKIKVRFGEEMNQTVREYDRDAVTVLPKNRPDQKPDQKNAAKDANDASGAEE